MAPEVLVGYHEEIKDNATFGFTNSDINQKANIYNNSLTSHQDASDTRNNPNQNILKSNISNLQDIHPITQFVRDNIIEPKSGLLHEWLFKESSLEQEERDRLAKMSVQQFRETLTQWNKDGKYQEELKAAYNNKELEIKFRQIESEGYANLHTTFPELKSANWQTRGEGRVIEHKNEDGKVLVTIPETTVAPFNLPNGQSVQKARSINMPLSIDPEAGGAHFTFTSYDLNGKTMSPPVIETSFHYSKEGQLIEANFPAGLQFEPGNSKAIGYFTHNGNTYTTGFTQDKYQEIMREVAKSHGMGAALAAPQEQQSQDTMDLTLMNTHNPSNLNLQEPLSPIPTPPPMPQQEVAGINITETRSFEDQIKDKAAQINSQDKILNAPGVEAKNDKLSALEQYDKKIPRAHIQSTIEDTKSYSSSTPDSGIGSTNSSQNTSGRNSPNTGAPNVDTKRTLKDAAKRLEAKIFDAEAKTTTGKIDLDAKYATVLEVSKTQQAVIESGVDTSPIDIKAAELKSVQKRQLKEQDSAKIPTNEIGQFVEDIKEKYETIVRPETKKGHGHAPEQQLTEATEHLKASLKPLNEPLISDPNKEKFLAATKNLANSFKDLSKEMEKGWSDSPSAKQVSKTTETLKKNLINHGGAPYQTPPPNPKLKKDKSMAGR